LKTLSRSGQEEDDATATRGGKSSRTDGRTTKEKCTESGVEKEDSYIRRGGATGITDFAIQPIPGQQRIRRVQFGGLKNTEHLAKR